MRTKKEILGKFSIELIEKENSMYSLDITLELNNAQIDVLTDILCQGYKGEHGERFSNLVEDTEITLAKILCSYDSKSPLTGIVYKGFSREFIKGSCKVRKWIAKMQIDE